VNKLTLAKRGGANGQFQGTNGGNAKAEGKRQKAEGKRQKALELWFRFILHPSAFIL
jgi:hypothetical protein